jgi:hypothetical protein
MHACSMMLRATWAKRILNQWLPNHERTVQRQRCCCMKRLCFVSVLCPQKKSPAQWPGRLYVSHADNAEHHFQI